MKEYFGQLLKRHPWLPPLGALLCALANAYEAIYVRPNSLMSLIDWAFAIIAFIAFLGLTVSVVSDYLYKTDD